MDISPNAKYVIIALVAFAIGFLVSRKYAEYQLKAK